jgi:hypothetical protein
MQQQPLLCVIIRSERDHYDTVSIPAPIYLVPDCAKDRRPKNGDTSELKRIGLIGVDRFRSAFLKKRPIWKEKERVILLLE